MSSEIERRKREHVELAAADALPPALPSGFDDVQLIHNALPEASPGAIDTSVTLLGHMLRLPLVIASMTGGYAGGRDINAALARAAQRHGIAMGVGSQRAALVEPALAASYAVARDEAPDAFLIANIGVSQLVAQRDRRALTLGEIESLVGMIRAGALVVHLNAIQELVQPEGQPDARGWLAAIEALAASVSVPVIAKETGGGMSFGVARRLRDAGVRALDVGGRGGTSFAAIEAVRAERIGDRRGIALGAAFRDWGIPTMASIAAAGRAGLPVIATGGVRGGLDAARAVAMGAVAVGVARPLLKAALDGGDAALDAWIEAFRTELVAAMYLTGSSDLTALAKAPRIVSGETAEWIRQLREVDDHG
ncbi:MAG: isopentenyl-diphosphate Delta-isomerase [Chloroflexota bacterium]|jgi:isopentenyl-diphosphate delta-isomerase|nr:isopentenyl-diphosphate Delta-isomerase [Chloroflexota bacterium]